MIKVLIVDDHGILRESLSGALNEHALIEVVALASDGRNALNEARRCQPDVVLMDIDMPGLSSFDAARQIASEIAQAKVLFFSAFSNDSYIEQALAAGAAGYVCKTEPIETLFFAIQEVHEGRTFFSEDVRARLIEVDGRPRVAAEAGSLRSSLSSREREVLGYVSKGLTRARIADTMCLSRKTIDRHIENIMRKTGLHDRLELARFAIREGLSEP